MVNTIGGSAFKQMVLFGAACINAQKKAVNDLNVFPVPDGDTGTNMSLTILTAVEELKKHDPATVDEAARLTASGLLRGARGNSGVILSLLFRGMSKVLKGRAKADGAALAAAMSEGVTAAYSAVMKPAEGTVLTVSRMAAARAVEAAAERNSVEYVLEQAIRAGSVTLEETIDMNPVLKKAGVVDAGGKGYLIILEGMLRCLRGEEMPRMEEEAARPRADFEALSEEDITFTFDTVFIVRKTGNADLAPLRRYLAGIGDSLVIGEDDEAFKVHVHTDIPGSALSEAQKYGELEVGKIENMRIQARDVAAGRATVSADDLEDEDALFAPAGEKAAPAGQEAPEAPAEITVPDPVPAEKKLGFLAVCAGAGIADTFRALGADAIVSGGQTMNPSTEAILAEVNRVPSEVVFVLPNNKNIVMAAQQCQGLTTKQVVVIPTATVPQGIAAMMTLDPTAEDAEAVAAAMTEAASAVTTAQITYAARDSDYDGFAIRAGDYLALLDGKLFDTDRSIEALLGKLAAYAASAGCEYINIYAGEGVSEAEAAAAEDLFAAGTGAEVATVRGGQPVYYYIISME